MGGVKTEKNKKNLAFYWTQNRGELVMPMVDFAP
jgi:hypothetical protein